MASGANVFRGIESFRLFDDAATAQALSFLGCTDPLTAWTGGLRAEWYDFQT